MILDLDTRKLAPILKKGDMFMFDGQKLVAINKEEMLKPIYEAIEKQEQKHKELELDVQSTFEKKLAEGIEKVIRGYAER